MARTGGKFNRREETSSIVGASNTSGELAEWRRFKQKTLNVVSLPNKKV